MPDNWAGDSVRQSERICTEFNSVLLGLPWVVKGALNSERWSGELEGRAESKELMQTVLEKKAVEYRSTDAGSKDIGISKSTRSYYIDRQNGIEAVENRQHLGLVTSTITYLFHGQNNGKEPRIRTDTQKDNSWISSREG